MRTTVELTIPEFKQELLHLLAQQMPMAEFEDIDPTDPDELDVTFKNNDTETTVDKITIVVTVPDKPLKETTDETTTTTNP